MKNIRLILIAFLLLFSFFLSTNQVAEAAQVNSSKRGLILMYNPSGGGLLASINILVSTTVVYNPFPKNNPNLNAVSLAVDTSTLKTSFTQCGGSMNTISPAKIGTQNISLPTDFGPHFTDARYQYHFTKSTSYGIPKGNQTVQASGQFYPNPSSCLGGGKVTNSFTFNNK